MTLVPAMVLPIVAPDDDEVQAISIVEFNTESLNSVEAAYKDDKRFRPVILNPEQYPMYQVEDNIIIFEGGLCIPTCIPTSDRRTGGTPQTASRSPEPF